MTGHGIWGHIPSICGYMTVYVMLSGFQMSDSESQAYHLPTRNTDSAISAYGTGADLRLGPVYCDIDPDIGADFNDIRYRCTPDIRVVCTSNRLDVGYTRYRVSGVHRYRYNHVAIYYRHWRISDIGYARFRVRSDIGIIS